MLERTGAELVLHGHEHCDVDERLRGPGGIDIPVRGIPSGTYSRDHHGLVARYRIFTIDGNRVARTEDRVWRAGAFAPA